MTPFYHGGKCLWISFPPVQLHLTTDLQIYNLNPDAYTIGPEFDTLETLINKQPEYASIKALMITQGLWIMEDADKETGPRLIYYQYIYNEEFSKKIGILEIETTDSNLQKLIQSIKAKKDDSILVLKDGIKLDYYSDPQLADKVTNLSVTSTEPTFLYNRKENTVQSHFNLGILGIEIYSSTTTRDIDLADEIQWLLVVFCFSLVMLSLIYYWIAIMLTRRILALANHMRNVDAINFTEIDSDVSNKDEIGFLTSSYNGMLRKINELVNTVHKAEVLKMQAEYFALQAQIKPHFLYNTLEAIRMMAEMSNATEIENFIGIFSRFIRYSISDNRYETTLADEVEHVRNYLMIHQNRVRDRLSFKFNIETEVRHVLCPRFILQPIVENSIIHVLNQSLDKCEIVIRIFRADQYIIITIHDNGMGIERERLEVINEVLRGVIGEERLSRSSGGIGLYNVNERIKLYFGEHSGLLITSEPNQGTVCTLRLFIGGYKFEITDS